jgi:SM-20-related protein
MITKSAVENLSLALLDDERIVTPQEKGLLAEMLRHAKTHSSNRSLTDAIARIAGEVVAERVGGVLGPRIVERIVDGVSLGHRTFGAMPPQPPSPTPPAPGPHRYMAMPPQPPSPTPPAPGPHHYMAMPPQPPSPTPPAPGPHRYVAMPPQPPSPTPPAPGPRRADRAIVAQEEGGGVAVLEEIEILPAQCVVLDEFLSPLEFEELLQDTLQREAEFEMSEVIAPGNSGSALDFDYRRSQVLMDLGKHREVITDRLRDCLPRVLPRLGRDAFEVSHIEAQITASNHGDFFLWHVDNGHADIVTRQITFVYFFHREPKAFSGGELRIYDTRCENGSLRPMENYRAVVPQQNKVVLFDSSLAHEITPVNCPSQQFVDSRFTVNGWFHR